MKLSKYNIIKRYNKKIVIYNSFSKSSLILEGDSDIRAFEDIEQFNKLDEGTKKVLIENGFIIDDSRDELYELKYIFEQSFFDTKMLNIVLVPSLLCNFKCPYCCEKDYKCGKENVKKYFKILKTYASKNFKNHNIVHISLFGGEPLLYAKDCLDFLNWVKEDSKNNNYQYYTSIVTNGSLLDENILQGLLNHNLLSLQITIDSDKKTHDQNRIFKNNKPSFDLLINKINELVPKTIDYSDFKFVVRINLNNTTVARVKKALEKIAPKNRENVYLLIRAIYNTHAYNEENSNSVNELQDYYDLGTNLGFNILKEKYNYQTCEACGDRKSFYLMPDLSIWKCINDIGYDKCSIGHIKEDGNVELVPENIINWYKNCTSAFSDSECLNCKLLPDCLGGCPLYKCKNGQKSCRPFDMTSLPNVY